MRVITYNADGFEGREVIALLKHYGCSRRIITKLKNGGNLQINGKKARTVDILNSGDVVQITLDDEKTLVPNPELDVEAAYEDDDIVVFNKPANMATHPSIYHYRDTLGNCFAAKYPDCSFRAINRLDRNTSGLCLVAKNQLAAANLSFAANNHPDKVYYAVVCGKITDSGEIIAPIGRVGDSIIKREVSENGLFAHTVYEPIVFSDEYTYVRVILKTGRTHQIRVHFSHIGHPLAGDDLYGNNTKDIERQALHCGEISFIHPTTRKLTVVKAEPPQDMQKLISMIK